jgi:hypothetical protein
LARGETVLRSHAAREVWLPSPGVDNDTVYAAWRRMMPDAIVVTRSTALVMPSDTFERVDGPAARVLWLGNDRRGNGLLGLMLRHGAVRMDLLPAARGGQPGAVRLAGESLFADRVDPARAQAWLAFVNDPASEVATYTSFPTRQPAAVPGALDDGARPGWVVMSRDAAFDSVGGPGDGDGRSGSAAQTVLGRNGERDIYVRANNKRIFIIR